jgi:mutator protein MutT
MEPVKRSDKLVNLAVIINKKGEVLIIKRKKEEVGQDGVVLSWAFPGGRQYENESREECVIREVLEETGYDVKVIRQLSFRIHPQFNTILFYHLCELVSEEQVQEPSESYEIEKIKWVKKEEISQYFTTDIDPKVKRELKLI